MGFQSYLVEPSHGIIRVWELVIWIRRPQVPILSGVVGDDDHPNQELIVSSLINLIRGLAFVSSGFIGASAVSLGEGIGI